MTEDSLLKQRDQAGSASGHSVERASNRAKPEIRCQLDAIRFSTAGDFSLIGWIDDRSSSLRHIRLAGRDWSRTIEGRHVGRFRRADADASAAENFLAGFWLNASLDVGDVGDEPFIVELTLGDGSVATRKMPGVRCAREELSEHLSVFLGRLEPGDRALPQAPLPAERRGDSANASPASFPKHNVEAILVAEDGGVFIAGWVDDALDPLREIRLSGDGWQIVFVGDALGRTRRDDVRVSLKSMRHHAFGYWGFASATSLSRGLDRCAIELITKDGARKRLDMAMGVVDRLELRDVVLSFLGSCTYLGNPQLDSVVSVSRSIGRHVVDLNARITQQIVAQPYVERFGRRLSSPKGSIVVCLYGKAEYIFLQLALFSAGAGIEDYEFIYVSNSPELSERLLREARIASLTFDVDLTLILLPGNAGFGAANNVAAKFARSDRLLIVNPDVFPHDRDWAAKHSNLLEQLPEDQTRIFGAPLFYDDGSLMHGGLYFDADIGISLGSAAFAQQTFLRVEHYGKGAPPATARFLASRPVPAVTGAFISCARGWFEKLGGFSEDYVLGHYEDADLCLRSLEAGGISWMHDLKLWHLEGKGSVRPPTLEGATTINRWLFNSLWSSKVIPNLIGASPRHPLMQTKAIVAGDKPPVSEGAAAPRANPSAAKTSPVPRVFKEVVFSTEGSL